MTPVMHDLTGVADIGDACIDICKGLASPVSLIPANNKPKLLTNFTNVIDTLP
jgi:hypothetical protein